MSTIKLPAASGGGSISIKGPASSGSDVDVLDTSGNLTVSGDIDLADNKKIKLGDGNDLEIYHDPQYGHSRIRELGGGGLQIETSTLEVYDATPSEKLLTATANGAVELYYDNSKKLETTSGGVASSGQIDINNSAANAVGDLDDPNDYGLVIRGSSTTGEGTGICFTNDDRSAVGSSICHIDNGSNNIGHLAFYTAESTNNPELRMIIKHNGEIGFGTSAPSEDFHFKGYVTRFQRVDVSSGTHERVVGFADSSNTERGNIKVSNASVQYNTSSDYRLKENQVSISDGITRIKALKPYKFNWKNDPDKIQVDGFFAHEVSSVVKEATSGQKDEVDSDDKPVYQGIDQSKLVPLLTAALKEAITKIETLETKVAALEAG